MDEPKLGVVEARFAGIIWDREPISSGELVRICAKELEWKKSTTYTVLKKLCERGFFSNEDGQVRSLLSREAYQAAQSRQFVEENYHGSLPAFFSAFSSGRKPSEQEVKEIRAMLDAWQGSEEKGV